MKFIEQLPGLTKQHIPALITILTANSIWLILIYLWYRYGAPIYVAIDKPTLALGLVISVLLLGLIALTSYLRKLKIKRLEASMLFTPRFGVLWDSSLNPYCPIHQTLIHFAKQEGNPHGWLWCKGCGAGYPLYDEKGTRLPDLASAQKLTAI